MKIFFSQIVNILKKIVLQEILYLYDPSLKVSEYFFREVDWKITTIKMH